MKILIVLFACLVPAAGWAGSNVRNFVELSPQYRVLNQEGFAANDSVLDVFGVLNSHIELTRGQWFAEMKPEIRAVASRGVKNPPTDPNAVTAVTSRRALNTRRMLTRESDGEAYFDFDRLNVKYSLAQGEIFAGRKPLSLGVLRFFPVWNKLTLPLVFQPGPEWIQNPDIAGASYQRGRFAYRAFAGRGDTAKRDDLALFETRFFGEGFELQVLAGHWWEHTAAGLTASIDAFQSTLRMESLWIARARGENSQLQFGLGIERALSAKWTLIGEALYQSAGLDDFANVTSVPNRFMVLGGKLYALPYFTYQLHPLWMLQAGMLAGFADDVSAVALGGFEHSLSDNTSLTLKIKWPVGAKRGEFGDERLRSPLTGATLGMSSTAVLQLQSTF